MMRAVKKFMFWKLAPIGFLKILNDITTISSPLLLREIIYFVKNSKETDIPLSRGFMYIVILFVLNILTTIFLNAFFQNTTTLGTVSIYSLTFN